MASKNEILASSSNLKGIVDEFNRNLTSFLDEMNECVNDVERSIENLGNFWKDENSYRDFKNKIMLEMRNISTQNERGKILHEKLEALANKYQKLIEYLEASGSKI